MAAHNAGRSSVRTTPVQVTIVRLALFLGVAVFGGVIWFVRSQEPEQSAAEGLEMLRYVFLAIVAMAVGVAAVMKRRQAATEEWGSRVTYAIIGWAACESTALFGGVYWLLTGDATLYAVGALILFAALILLAPRKEGTAA
jgi:hypothetical protein